MPTPKVITDYNVFLELPPELERSRMRYPFCRVPISEAEISNFYLGILIEQRGLKTLNEVQDLMGELQSSRRQTESYLNPKTPLSPYQQAQRTMHQAVRANGRQRQKLARRALALYPYCADAYVVLAEEFDVADSLSLLEEGMEAGVLLMNEQLGQDKVAPALAAAEQAGAFTDEEDLDETKIMDEERAAGIGFWGHEQTRPYMRCRSLLAYRLQLLGRHDEALGHYRALLRLCPKDNPGNRIAAASLLARTSAHDKMALTELTALMNRYSYDLDAPMSYLEALRCFQLGRLEEADETFEDAYVANNKVIAMLAGLIEVVDIGKLQAPGSPEEASDFLVVAGEALKEERVFTWMKTQFFEYLQLGMKSLLEDMEPGDEASWDDDDDWDEDTPFQPVARSPHIH